MMNVLVTGGMGQLAKSIKDIEAKYPNIKLHFKSSTELDITKKDTVKTIFNNQTFDYCINCAAYTAVDNAEKDSDSAYKVNELGVKNLAKECHIDKVILIHISTDFVFGGSGPIAYTEKDETNPQNVYGFSKLKGELAIEKSMNQYFILRTSWLYSEHNKNFMKTMIKLASDRQNLNVVDDQIGTPTYTKDLAEVIFKIIDTKHDNYGTYHYSNEGIASWYDFAYSIFDEINSDIKLLPIKTIDYPTPAKRPLFSVLDKSKIKENLNIHIPHWRSSLREAISNLKQ
ncbi:dTDP-4-dehydrorhamnose reductase [Winogradskyella luteola]